MSLPPPTKHPDLLLSVLPQPMSARTCMFVPRCKGDVRILRDRPRSQIVNVLSSLADALKMSGSMTWQIALVSGFRVHPVGRRPGGRTPGDHHAAPRRRSAGDAGQGHRARRGELVVLVRRRRAGPLALPQGRELHLRHGFRDRQHQPGHRARHHPGALLGWQFTAAEFVGGPIMILVLAVLFRLLPAPSAAGGGPGAGRARLAGSMEGHAAMDMSVHGEGSFWQRLGSRRRDSPR